MRNSFRSLFAALLATAILFPIPAHAAQTLIEVQAKVRDLQEQATTAAENAQAAKVQLNKLKKTLDSVQQQATQVFSYNGEATADFEEAAKQLDILFSDILTQVQSLKTKIPGI